VIVIESPGAETDYDEDEDDDEDDSLR